MNSTITLSVKDANEMNAYVATPDGNGPFPGIILFQEAFGVNGHIRDVAERIAAEGYVVIAPELFHRTAPAGFESGYNDFSLVAPHYQALDTAKLAEDAIAAFAWLTKQPNVLADRIGCVGFCLGGKVAFIANATVPVACAVSFYGGGTHTIADLAGKLHAPHVFFWGGKDKHILPEHVETVVGAVKNAGKAYANIVFSEADHAFFCNERGGYHADSAKEAWAFTKAFFENKLKG